jgi:hypothetical protein
MKAKSPLQELADQADKALELCWQRLHAKDVTDEDIHSMVDAWRLKRRVHTEVEEARAAKKEAKQSDD